MKRVFAAILSVITTMPTLLLAKGETVKIAIESPELRAPFEITDPAVRQFEVWAGPGTFFNGVEGRQDFIIWSTNTQLQVFRNLAFYLVKLNLHILHM